MMEGENEGDLYDGYNEYNPLLDTENLTYDPQFRQAVLKTSSGRRPPPTSMRMPTALKTGVGRTNAPVIPPTTAMRRGTAAPGTASQGGARPMTAVSGAGYSSKPMHAGLSGDPASMSVNLEPKVETEEDKIKQLERKVCQLAEESCQAVEENDKQAALEKAKESYKKERLLFKQREEKGLSEQNNIELTGFILLNMAEQLTNAGMFGEALNIYNILTKNKIFPLSDRLKTNIGNIHFEQKAYLKAIKMFRMALDKIPGTNHELKLNIHRNIAFSFIKMGQYTDAASNYEIIFKEKPDFKVGFNLLLCYYAMSDREKMKQCFIDLLRIPINVPDDDYYQSNPTDKQANLILEVIRDDQLRRYERKKRRNLEHCVVTAVKLIAPAIDTDFANGYEWCIEQVKASPYIELSHDLEIQKAIVYLKAKNFTMAVETLKEFEKRDAKVASSAATNLSFLYFLENDLTNAHKYADLSLKADKYNPAALTNKGNCYFAEHNYDRAKYYYEDALKIDASCVEALYNLGLTCKKLNMREQSLDQFFKLHAMQRSNTQVYCQIAECNLKSDPDQALSWFMQALSAHPKDSELLKRIGCVYDEQSEKSQAFQYYHDAYKYDPSNLETIEWLGSYYIDSQYPEKAVEYFEKAALGRPHQVKWQLMVASCYRRSGNYAAALEKYKMIHMKFPDNIECLKFLVRICSDLALPDAHEYATKLKKAEKMKEVQQSRVQSSEKRQYLIKGRKSFADDLPSENVGTSLIRQESRDSGNQSLISRQNSRGNSGSRKPDLNDVTDGHSNDFHQKVDNENIEYPDYLGKSVERPKTAIKRSQPNVPQFDEDAADLLPD